MVSEAVRNALDTAERAFERSPRNVEAGLDVDSAEMVQLRRARRLLDAATLLLEEGYFTVVIELLKNERVFGIAEIEDFRRRRSSP